MAALLTEAVERILTETGLAVVTEDTARQGGSGFELWAASSPSWYEIVAWVDEDVMT